MMKFIANLLASLSLKGKMRIILGSIFIITTASIISSVFLGNIVSNQYRRSINYFQKIETDLFNLQIQMLEITRTEKDFMSSRDEIYLDLIKESYSDFQKSIKTLDNDAKDILEKEAIKTIDNSLQSYINSFNEIVKLASSEGNQRKGMIGELSKLSQQINKQTGELVGPRKYKITLYANKFIEASKDYLSTWKTSYIGNTKNAHQELLKIISGSNSSKLINLERLSSNYLNLLDQIHKNHIKLKNSSQDLQKHILTAEEYILKGIDTIEKTTQDQIKGTQKIESFINVVKTTVVFITFLIMFIALLLINRTTKALSFISDRIRLSSHDTKKSSVNLKSTSNRVSVATTEQASAIQETVATLNEITAMVNKSVENANSSAEKANLSHQIAFEGREAVNQMREAMDEIQNSITQMMTRVEEGNQQIESIVKIIGKISSKTTIINDIVFQTKLLSFNASVEAARAGDHGKGFAVVAEEVGNLAQMSGNASKEISELLRTSRESVEHIVKDSKKQMGKLVQEGSNKVAGGVDVANRCDEILGEVVDHVSHVKELMHEISNASKEQAEGVHNISIAMNELDATTHSNSDMAHETSDCSNLLSEQSEILSQAILELESEIFGADKDSATNQQGFEFNFIEEFFEMFKFKKRKKAKDKTILDLDATESISDDLPTNVHKISSDHDEDEIAEESDTSSNSSLKKVSSGFEDIPSADDPNFKD